MSEIHLISMNPQQESTQQINFSYDDILLLLKQLSNSDNSVRNKAEDYLTSLKYELKFYEILFNIFKSENMDKYYKVQSILVVKNFLRQELNSGKRHRIQANENEQHMDFSAIEDCIQKEIVEVINIGKFDQVYQSHLKELILLIGEKKFPANWPDLMVIFSKIYEIPMEILFSDENTFTAVYYLNELFYSLLKQNNKKRIPQTRMKFLQMKASFVEMFCPFYEKVTVFFNQNFGSFTNLDFIARCLSLMTNNDKVLLVLIDSSFSINDFHKDEKLMIMLKTILDRTLLLLNQVNENQIKEMILKNVFKNIKNLAKIQAANPVVMYKYLESYVNILVLVLVNCDYFNQEVLKAVFFALYKVISTVSYKELTEDYVQSRRYSEGGGMNLSLTNALTDRTPEKQKRGGGPVLVSPTKFKNFETELREANDIFADCFKDQNVRSLLDNLLKKVPFVFRKETENLEIELLADIEEELAPTDHFSTTTMSWLMLYKNLLESFIIIFPQICLQYCKEVLEMLYSNEEDMCSNILYLDSFISFVNLLPSLYKNNIISEIDMIDSTKFLCFLESIMNKSEILLKKYIVTISKWSDVLISNDSVFNYVDNLLYFLTNSKNSVILLECCLALKNIIMQFDRYMKKDSSQNINTAINKNKLTEEVKSRINWGAVLSSVSSVCLGFLANIKSAELMLSLINLFTYLLQKCHFQCDGKIVEIIQNSKLTVIIQELNDEFAQNAFIEMWKSLLVSFPNSSVIVDLTLQFVSITLKKDIINTHNLGLLLFTVKIIDQTDEIRSLLINFLKEHISIFQNTSKQFLSVILFNVLEELSLFNIFDSNDIGNIISLCQEKYISLFELSKELRNKYLLEKESFKINNTFEKRNDEFILSDTADYKIAILNVINTIYTFFFNIKKIDISQHLKTFLRILLEETVLSQDGPTSLYSTGFLLSLIPLINRISVTQFDFFKNTLSELLSEKGCAFDYFFQIWINRMAQMTSLETRKLNVLTICKLLPLLDKDTFMNNMNEIFHICLITVHMEMIRKLDTEHPEHISTPQMRIGNNSARSLNIRQSSRKRYLFEQDPLIKIDLHSLFVENFEIVLKNIGYTYQYLVDHCITNLGMVNTLNQILGLVSID